MELTAERDTKQAMLFSFKRTCPRCGKGHMFNGYLAVSPECSNCGLDLKHQRADDGPAYLTIVIVGHLLVPLFVPAYKAWDLHPAVMATVFSTLAVALSLILPPASKEL
ncbi:DUF983 domain-containing protein [Ruegeria sp. R13_0]|uniref:DUF983 domain-containing protein n=1 Tax=Ruegeria sp. R13_0 TaxID=2821099 RepID=UPI001FFDF667|nr:DUF983 domain-containing protein [Ruegeria sp. R13_0]